MASRRTSTPAPTLRQRGVDEDSRNVAQDSSNKSASKINSTRNDSRHDKSRDQKPDEKYQQLFLKKFQDMLEASGAAEVKGKYAKFWSQPFCARDFCWAELKKSLPRNSFSQAWLQKNLAGHYERLCPGGKALWDVTFRHLPHVASTAPADFFAVSGPVLLVIRFMVVPGPLSLRWTILRRWLTVWGMIWMIRSATIIVTPLPNPDSTCQPTITFPDNLFAEALFIALKQDLTCQDVRFSGHTVALTLSMLFIFKYTPRAPWSSFGASRAWFSVSSCTNFAGILFCALGYYFIAASRFHYTLDVLVGALITYTTFNGYHGRIELAALRKQHGGRSILDPLLYWLEKHSRDLQEFSKGQTEAIWLERH